jgi:hypothetical protein
MLIIRIRFPNVRAAARGLVAAGGDHDAIAGGDSQGPGMVEW